jgi:hypothetical protein
MNNYNQGIESQSQNRGRRQKNNWNQTQHSRQEFIEFSKENNLGPQFRIPISSISIDELRSYDEKTCDSIVGLRWVSESQTGKNHKPAYCQRRSNRATIEKSIDEIITLILSGHSPEYIEEKYSAPRTKTQSTGRDYTPRDDKKLTPDQFMEKYYYYYSNFNSSPYSSPSNLNTSTTPPLSPPAQTAQTNTRTPTPTYTYNRNQKPILSPQQDNNSSPFVKFQSPTTQFLSPRGQEELQRNIAHYNDDVRIKEE